MKYELTAFSIGIVSMGAFVLKMLLMLMMGFDDEGDFESDGIYAVFSINKVLAFFMGFGFSHHEFGEKYYISIPVGLALAVIYHFVMKRVRKMSSPDKIVTTSPTVGDHVSVYSKVTKNSGIVLWHGREFDAYAWRTDQTFNLNDVVEVKETLNDKILLVDKLD